MIYATEDLEAVDAAVVVFETEQNQLYLFSDSQERLRQEDYLYTVMNLVHDLPVDFKLHTKLRSNSVKDYPFCELFKEVDSRLA